MPFMNNFTSIKDVFSDLRLVPRPIYQRILLIIPYALLVLPFANALSRHPYGFGYGSPISFELVSSAALILCLLVIVVGMFVKSIYQARWFAFLMIGANAFFYAILFSMLMWEIFFRKATITLHFPFFIMIAVLLLPLYFMIPQERSKVFLGWAILLIPLSLLCLLGFFM